MWRRFLCLLVPGACGHELHDIRALFAANLEAQAGMSRAADEATEASDRLRERVEATRAVIHSRIESRTRSRNTPSTANLRSTLEDVLRKARGEND